MSENHVTVNQFTISGKQFVTGCSILALSLLLSTAMMSRAILKASGRYTPLWSDQNVITQDELDATERSVNSR